MEKLRGPIGIQTEFRCFSFFSLQCFYFIFAIVFKVLDVYVN